MPFGPGSATDTITRVVGQHLSVALKQTVVVENRPGANGALAALFVARSAPDGYTLFMSTNSPHSAVPFLMKNVAYDPVKDFAAITRMGSYTLMLCIHPSIPAKSVKELIEYAKANPGKLSFASGNTSGVVAGETLKHWAENRHAACPLQERAARPQRCAGRPGVDDVHRPDHRAAARQSGHAARPGGDAAAALDADPRASHHGRGGRQRVRHGFLGRQCSLPAHTPPDIVTLLNTELRKIIDSPEVKSKLGNVGFEAFSSSPQELDDFVKVQLGKWGKMIKDAGIEPE